MKGWKYGWKIYLWKLKAFIYKVERPRIFTIFPTKIKSIKKMKNLKNSEIVVEITVFR